jgi:NADH dehydrogenase (ubiquinone) 1 beta subcomplex subunit 9
MREMDSWYGGDLLEVRYQKVLMRARFDANADEKDTRKAQLLLADGCRELWEKRHFKTFRCK